MKFQTENNTIK